METVNLLILDFDGTLADCKPLHQQAFRKACTKVNNAIQYTDEEVEGMPTFGKIDYIKAKGYKFDETLLMDLKQEYTMNDLSKYVKFDQELKDIFVRLSKRDNKSTYLKYLPYTWSLINRRLKNPIFKNFQLLLNKHVKIKKLKKINNL